MEKRINPNGELNSLVKRLPEETALIIILAALCIVITILSPYFLTFNNIMNIILYISISGIAAIGMTMVILTGGIDLSVGAMLALAGWVAAFMMKAGQNVFLSMGVALMVGLLMGGINAFSVTQLKVPPLIATLAMLSMGRGLQTMMSKGKTIYSFPDAFGFLGGGSIGPIPMPVILTVALYIIAGIVLSHTRYGRAIYAVGGNPEASRISGIEVPKIINSVYLISGFLSAFAGLLLISRMDAAPSIMANGLELQAIAGAVIGGTSVTCGGKGKIFGTFLGVCIMGVVSNALDLLNVSPYYQQFIQGLIILMAVAIDMARVTKLNKI
jgi:ribose/xylose/arabinose/galactoside ABC-type transport system permease subunit